MSYWSDVSSRISRDIDEIKKKLKDLEESVDTCNCRVVFEVGEIVRDIAVTLSRINSAYMARDISERDWEKYVKELEEIDSKATDLAEKFFNKCKCEKR